MIDHEMRTFEAARKRATEAHNALLTKLFGSVPEDASKCTTTRKAYKQAMHEVEQEYSLVEGDGNMILFVLEQLSRSPKFKDEGAEV